MMLTVRSDPDRRSGGYALLGGDGLDGLDGIGLEDCQSGMFLGPDGKWTKVRSLLPVSASGSRELSLGPSIVDSVPTDTQVTIYDPHGKTLGTLFWSDILPSRQDRGRERDLPTFEPRTIIPSKVHDENEGGRQERLAQQQAEEKQAEKDRAETERANKERAEKERQARDRADERDRQAQIARNQARETQQRHKHEKVATRTEPLPLLAPLVWRACLQVFRERPSLLVPCLIAPCFFTYLIRQVDVSWQHQLPEWIFTVAGRFSALHWFSAAMYLYHAFVLALVACLIAKICQHVAVWWTYGIPAVGQGIDAASPQSALVAFLRIIVISTPTLFACGLATTLHNPLLGQSTYLLMSLSLAIAAPFPSMLPASLLECRSISDAFGRARDLQRGGNLAAMTTALAPVVLLVAGLVAIILAYNGAAYELSLSLLPCVFPLSGVVTTVLFAELRRRHEMHEAAGASARVEEHASAFGGVRP